MTVKLLVLGGGSLAREVLLALPGAAVIKGLELDVVVASRDRARAEWLCLLGAARAKAINAAVRYYSVGLSWESDEILAETIGQIHPNMILHTASLQSAWSMNGDDAWSRLCRLGGYGITTALQAALLPRLGRALRACGFDGPLINACYPDVVNAGAAAMGLRITCGLGNIALLAALFGRYLGWPPHALRLLAGHWDVNEMSKPCGERCRLPAVWLDETRVSDAYVQHCPPLFGDSSMNALSAGATAAMLCAFLTDDDLPTFHVPGPCNLIGGYPVRLSGGALAIDLPAGVALEEAIVWNRARALLDGATVEAGERLVFEPLAAERLATVAPELSDGFKFQDVEWVAAAFLDLRSRLRCQPAAVIGPASEPDRIALERQS